MELRRRVGQIGVVLLLAGAAVSCGSDGPGSGESSSSPSVTQVAGSSTPSAGLDEEPEELPRVESVVAATVQEPIKLIERPGDEGYLWLAERAGRVRRLIVADGGNALQSAGDYALDISDETTTEAERGLLGLAFSPDGGLLYTSSTDLEGNTLVASYEMSDDEVDASSRKVLFTQDQPFPNHNGGNIAFGPDGQLWLGLGDGGSSDDPDNRAQDPSTFLGKMVRIDPATGDTDIVVSGVRNPWRWSFDTDGSLWIGDVGERQIEEINRLSADAIEGANLGWSGYEGSQPYLDGDGRRPADAVPPVFEYSRQGGNCSITGGFVYRGAAIPALTGAYLFADYCAGRVRAITLDESETLGQEFDLGIDVEQPISFGADAEGEPYVLSQTGNIVRIIPTD